ncbi:MAG: gamma-glutamyltransferase [Solirubrobacterales bacterium]
MAMSQHHAIHGGVQVASRRGAVSAGHPLEVAAGLEMLEAGGNAMDAVVAGAFVACVVEPNNVSIAGYGHLSAYLAADDRFLTVDHNPRAPRRATPDMFELVPEAPEGHDWPATVGDRNSTGPLAVAVPGAVRGLYEAHRHAGRLAWADVLGPAIRAAQEGVEVHWNLLLLIAAHTEAIQARPDTARLLMPGGRLPRAASEEGPGDRLDQAELADVLARIADEGPDAFHRGPVADAIAAELAGRQVHPRRAGPGRLPAARLRRAAAHLPRPALRDQQRHGRLRGAEHPRALRAGPRRPRQRRAPAPCWPRPAATRSSTRSPTTATPSTSAPDRRTDLQGLRGAARGRLHPRPRRRPPVVAADPWPFDHLPPPVAPLPRRRPAGSTAPPRSSPPTPTATWSA